MKAKPDISLGLARRLFQYDPATGALRWAESRGGTARAGTIAGAVSRYGYRRVGVDGEKYMAHRIAWLMTYGTPPEGDIDHINGLRDDNRIANLREVPRLLNSQNRRAANTSSKTGVLGVTRTRNGERFKAQIADRGSITFLGCFDTADQAHAAYVEAKRRLHRGCTL
jgi:hypothetical protein